MQVPPIHLIYISNTTLNIPENRMHYSFLILDTPYQAFNQEMHKITKKENLLATWILQLGFGSFADGARCWLGRYHQV